MLNRQINWVRASRVLYALLTTTILSLSTVVMAGIRGQGSETIPPTVQVLVPVGGETFTAGTAIVIKFMGADNDALSGFLVAFSADGGVSFPIEIARVGPQATEVIWNVPDSLETIQGRIQVTARDQSGNTTSAVSGIFTVQKPPPMPGGTISNAITFDPPPSGVCASPQNVRIIGACPNNLTDSQIGPAAAEGVVGYNIYRLPARPDGSLPPVSEIVQNQNLIGSIPADVTCFNDMVSTSKGNNFLYSLTSFCSNGTQTGGSLPTETNLPIIKNPIFKKGTLFIDAAGSFIVSSGAILIVNDRDAFPLQLDETAAHFTVPKMKPGSGGRILKKVIKKGSTVILTVKNPDGKLSVSVLFTRK
jgi:hypothetical protein